MPTSNNILGQLAKLAFRDEAAFGAPAVGLYTGAYFYKSSLREVAPPEQDDIIGGDFQNFRDARPTTTGLSTHDGELELPLCLNGLGDWLTLLLGPPVSTAAGADVTHVFTSGLGTLPSRTIEIKAGANDFRQHVGLAAKSLKFSAKDDKGFQRLSLSLMGMGENLAAATASTSAPAARPLDQVKATGFSVFYNGVMIGKLLESDWTYTTGVVAERYIDSSPRISDMSLSDTAQISGTMKLRYTGQVWDAIAIAESVGSLEFRASRAANRSLSLFMPAVRLGRAGFPITGPGGVEQSIPFQASQTLGDAMLAATLKNQQTGY